MIYRNFFLPKMTYIKIQRVIHSDDAFVPKFKPILLI